LDSIEPVKVQLTDIAGFMEMQLVTHFSMMCNEVDQQERTAEKTRVVWLPADVQQG
jgi:hypothetical protein